MIGRRDAHKMHVQVEGLSAGVQTRRRRPMQWAAFRCSQQKLPDRGGAQIARGILGKRRIGCYIQQRDLLVSVVMIVLAPLDACLGAFCTVQEGRWGGRLACIISLTFAFSGLRRWTFVGSALCSTNHGFAEILIGVPPRQTTVISEVHMHMQPRVLQTQSPLVPAVL